MHKRLAAATLLGALTFSPAASAGRPLQTDDAGVLASADCEVEGATLHQSINGAHSSEHGVGWSCGIGWKSQVGLGLSSTRNAGQTARNAQLGGKTGLWRGEGDDAVALALAWSVGMARDSAQGWQHSAKKLSLVASLPVGAATVHLNLGQARDVPSRLVATTWGAALEHTGFELDGLTWAPMAELFGNDRGSPWWNLGLRATLAPEKFFFDLSYGRQTGGDKPRLVTAGFKFAF